MKKRFMNVLMVFLFVVGLGILLYPFISNWVAERQMVSKIRNYEAIVGALSEEARNIEWGKAKRYNEQLRTTRDVLPKQYQTILAVEEMMGAIEIPKIGVNLPIYHGVEESVLQRGVGHIEGTSIPVGGMGTHAFLTAHTGLPSVKLFSDLNRLDKGDEFFIEVLGTTLVYRVCEIEILEPDQVFPGSIAAGEDTVTLMTCTPYGINSHRLLVVGERVAVGKTTTQLATDKKIHMYAIALLLSCAGIILVLILSFVFERRHRKKQAR